MKVFNPKTHAFEEKGEGKKEKKLPPAQKQEDQKAAGRPLDKALEDSFPASDPPAVTTPKEREGQ
jgi:hypothetical protein